MPSLSEPLSAQTHDGAVPTRAWRPSTRMAWRFFFLLTVLFSALNLAPELLWRLPFTVRFGQLWFQAIDTFWRPVVRWVARDLLHLTPTRVFVDATAPSVNQLVGVFCMVVLAAAFTVVWSYLDRRRANYRAVDRWLRTYLRFGLGIILISYGVEKVLLNQFDYPPNPTQLTTPVGMLSPFWMLVAFTASAPIYQVFAGVVEVLAAVFLMIRRTATVGALLAVAATANVVVLNYAYHFGMYVLATSMLVMAVYLALPELPRLANVLVLDRAVPARPRQPLFADTRVNAAARALGVVFLLMVIGHQFHASFTTGRHSRGRPPLYGAFEVQTFLRNRDTIPALSADSARWRGLTVDPTPIPNPAVAAFGTVAFLYDTSTVSIRVDTMSKILTLTSQRNPKQVSRLTYSIPDAEHVVLAGIDNLRRVSAGNQARSDANSASSIDGKGVTVRERADSLQITLRRIDLHALPLIRTQPWFR